MTRASLMTDIFMDKLEDILTSMSARLVFICVFSKRSFFHNYLVLTIEMVASKPIDFEVKSEGHRSSYQEIKKVL